MSVAICERQNGKKDRTCVYFEVLQIRNEKTVFSHLNYSMQKKKNKKKQTRDLTFFHKKPKQKVQIHVSHTTKKLESKKKNHRLRISIKPKRVYINTERKYFLTTFRLFSQF